MKLVLLLYGVAVRVHVSNIVVKSSEIGKIKVFFVKICKMSEIRTRRRLEHPHNTGTTQNSNGEGKCLTGETQQTTCRSFGFGTVDEWFAY